MDIDPAKILLEIYEADTDKYFDDHPDATILGPPLVGVADAADPWFARFKTILGEFHWTPQEALATAAPDARARSVICWSLAVSEIARKANRSEDQFPAREWSYVRNSSTALLKRMGAGLTSKLQEMGCSAMVPMSSPRNDVSRREGVGLAGRWSERHAAFVAGLGTFGLSGGLITSRGVAHRLGSVVSEAEIPSTSRPYGDEPFAWCLRVSQGKCGKCIHRCPVNSIGETPDAREKELCRKHVRDVIAPWAKDAFGWEAPSYGCGLCQTAVPCESRNPCEPKQDAPESRDRQ